MYEYNMSIACK